MRRTSRRARTFALAFMLVATMPGMAQADADAALAAQGWQYRAVDGRPPMAFAASAAGTILVRGEGAVGLIARSVTVDLAATPCLVWRWRVEAGPPPTPLLDRGGDDRALAVWVGFRDAPPGTTLHQRAALAMARTAAGRPVPGAILMYVHGGTAMDGARAAWATSPYLSGLARLRVLRPAEAAAGGWWAEEADVARDFRAAYGIDPPPVLEIAIASDGDDTASRIAAEIEPPRFAPCRAE
ncbi:MAG: DUF3047 domain-containing protein [Alphaproteobacteria bacterium]|nr:DUF3047 domain-containing protein [Alphaproteobacteria bacterium]